jgi:hypothetical protein
MERELVKARDELQVAAGVAKPKKDGTGPRLGPKIYVPVRGRASIYPGPAESVPTKFRFAGGPFKSRKFLQRSTMEEVLPHQASAALRVRNGQPRQAVARNAGADIVDLGMGNPDLPAPAHVIEDEGDARQVAHRPLFLVEGHSGCAARRPPITRRFGWLNPDTQIVATLGQGRLRQCRAGDHRAGRRRAGARPELPIHAFGFLMAGGVIRSVPSDPTPEFFAIRARHHPLDPEADRGGGVLPSNRPRTWPISISTRSSCRSRRSTASSSLSDLAYAEVYFDNNPPPSVLQVNGAMELAVEFTSMSKTYSMPGLAHGLCGRQRAHHRR